MVVCQIANHDVTEGTVPDLWAGVDIGKRNHHCVVINADGERVLSRRVQNDEPDLLQLVDDVLTMSDDVLWAVDINHGIAALLLGLLLGRDQPIAYLTGRAIHQASATYRGEGKTDARDAFIIADQARVRRDVSMLRPGDQLAVDLRLLTARRLDVVFDKTRQINRLRAQLLAFFPALERCLDLTKKGPVTLLTRYQTPAAIRRLGVKRLENWLRNRKVSDAAALAGRAVEATQAQQTTLPGEQLGAELVARLANAVLAHREKVAELDARIEARFRLLGAEFIAATGGDLSAFGSPDRLAGFAGLAPVPWDSGNVSGNLRRPRRYHRGLQRSLYLSAQVSVFFCPVSKAYYNRKRSEGKGHKQAVIALARRRTNVLWAMIRDKTPYQGAPPLAAAA